MEIEIKNWWKQAETDLHSSENSLNSGDYYLSAFMSQQSVEKALKALYIQEKKELLKTHSVSRLAQELKLPENFLKSIALLEPVYQDLKNLLWIFDGVEVYINFKKQDILIFLLRFLQKNLKKKML